ncbi:MAG: DUF4382 domain-containing protein [Flavisolibacter sp.]|jgi:hypothetical protein
MKYTFIFRKILAFLLLSILFVDCKKEASPGNKGPVRAQIFLTDHPTPIFDSVFIDIQKLEVKFEDSTLQNSGWVTLTIQPGVYNILRFRNGLDTLFAGGNLPSNNIRKLRMTLGNQNSVVKNAISFPLRINSNDMQVVANLSDSNFDIASPGQLFFWIDFDAGNSIRTDNSGPGNNNGFILKPHIRIFTKSKSGRIEGRVLPIAADAIVMAIRGTDTTMAIPDDHDGEYKIVGLNAGTYSLFIDGQNGYIDTLINNIVVRNGEDAHVPSVTLHQ